MVNYTPPSPGGSDVWGEDLNEYIASVTTGQPGSADRPPSSPNAKDDEFDGTSSVTWTATPTAPNTWNIDTNRESHAYIEANGTGDDYVGRYQAVPGAYPYTITAKVSSSARADYQRGGGIILAPASPIGTSQIGYFGTIYAGGRAVRRIVALFNGTYISQSAVQALAAVWSPVYLRVTVNSATSIDFYTSTDGYAWLPVELGVNIGITPAFMGVACNEEGTAGPVESWYDFFRVT